VPISVLNEWRPSQTRKVGHLPIEGIMPRLRESDYSTRIQLGTIIVFGERRAYEVLEVNERPVDLWPEHFVKEWDRFTQWWVEQVMAGRDMGPQPEKNSWEHRPVVLVIRPADQPTAKAKHYAVRASRPFYVLPQHYSICRLCHEIPPCTHVTTELAVETQMKATELLLDIRPGCCLGCGKPITSRMKAVRFPGANLWRPDMGENSAVFHARKECADDVSRYRRQWEQRGHAELQEQLPLEGGE
jgi:hypothetical protein